MNLGACLCAISNRICHPEAGEGRRSALQRQVSNFKTPKLTKNPGGTPWTEAPRKF